MDGIEKQGDALVASAAAKLRDARRIVVFTGAGVSTESGIPDFRSPGGIWDRYDARRFNYQRYLTEPESRRQSWQLRRELLAMDFKPNPAHLACTRLAEAGRLAGVMTQNIDGLHTEAGVPAELVCELHGSGRWAACLSCQERIPMAEAVARVEAGEDDLACTRCGGIMKPTTVTFGQELPRDVWEKAETITASCDGFLAVGSSLVVYPAARLPELAREVGATVVIVNREPTPLDPLADVVLRGECGQLLPRLVDTLLDGT